MATCKESAFWNLKVGVISLDYVIDARYSDERQTYFRK